MILFIAVNYRNQREKIADVFETIEHTHGLLLKDYKNQFNFFTQETKNRVFFEFGTSEYVDNHKSLFNEIRQNVSNLSESDVLARYELDSELELISSHISTYDSTFNQVVENIKIRGFKDYNLIGKMRKAAHNLESLKGVDLLKILMLRRHEKDYLLRYENIYLKDLNQVAKEIQTDIRNSSRLSDAERITQLNLLKNYLDLFDQIVKLDKVIGIKDNSGLVAALNDDQEELTREFDELLLKAKLKKEEQFNVLKWITVAVISIFIILGIWVSFLTSKRITKPLTELTSYITKFVESNFTFTGDKEFTISEDEIGRLTLNFNVMRDKIIEQLTFFKQKVEERTAELAEANKKLVRVNEANSRFVPAEFLKFLNRKSIEEVRLGDNIEQNMTVLFSDIRGFTNISEQMTPQENFDFINSYLKHMVPLVRKHNGFVDKYIGDSVMALFPKSVDCAIKCAINSQKVLLKFNARRVSDGKAPLQVGIGMHTGKLILGTIGAENRMETTVISDAVNTASRMEGLTNIYGAKIIASQEVINQLKSDHKYHVRFLDEVIVKGKEKAIGIYEILDGLEEYELKSKWGLDDTFQEGIKQFKEQDFDAALRNFEDILIKNPNDHAALFYKKRSLELMGNGASNDDVHASVFKRKK
ncbi:MAG: adenylate/guanylate cyclase domain-containing protein [Bacteroidota bacterium]